MISKSISSKLLSGGALTEVYQDLCDCRTATLALFEGIDYTTFCSQPHPDFSPVGWHLGHIAYTEALWILQHLAKRPPLFPEYHRLFAADGLPKADRMHLPTLVEVQHYLEAVRTQVLNYLEVAPFETQERLWRWLIQHESQHSETITFVLQLQGWQQQWKETLPARRFASSQSLSANSHFAGSDRSFTPTSLSEMIEIPAGYFEQGQDAIAALDNERPMHRVYLETYWIDRYPVTCGQYQAFITAGGYQNPDWWSAAGWQWRQANSIQQPLYWTGNPMQDLHPVCGVSWYEADAYARFVGKRLPTEAEWEKAASWDAVAQQQRTYPWGEAEPQADLCNHHCLQGQTSPVNAYPTGQSPYGCYDMLGNVWEWTASWFEAYEGFTHYPYPGYSQVYFDGEHRVLRGGSWATRPWALRCAFRNWYHPDVRQILAGFRCAHSLNPTSL